MDLLVPALVQSFHGSWSKWDWRAQEGETATEILETENIRVPCRLSPSFYCTAPGFIISLEIFTTPPAFFGSQALWMSIPGIQVVWSAMDPWTANRALCMARSPVIATGIAITVGYQEHGGIRWVCWKRKRTTFLKRYIRGYQELWCLMLLVHWIYAHLRVESPPDTLGSWDWPVHSWILWTCCHGIALLRTSIPWTCRP